MKRFSLFIFLILISFSCEKSDNWVSLLNENDLKGWHYYNDNGNKIGWSVENGVLSFDPTLAKFKRDQDGNIINDENGNPKIERNDIVTDLDYRGMGYGKSITQESIQFLKNNSTRTKLEPY